MNDYRILLYYCYTPIADPATFREAQHRLCLSLGLRGRIIVAPEGLNGTVSGLAADCATYMNTVKADPRFAALEFKVDQHDQHGFQKLYVRLKDEIVNSDLPVDPLQRTGAYLEPVDFQKLKNDPDVVLVDMRSRYEHSVGRFRDAVTFDMDNLRELPGHMAEIEHLKNKTIVTYCTGGIKCEKASAYLLSQGFENVYQLHGGIIKYGLETNGEDFEGECYVFDNRLTVNVNQASPSVISACLRCGTTTARMINCAAPSCNNHVPMCETCGDTHAGTCRNDCKADPNLRVYDGTGYYVRQSNHYRPEQGFKTRLGQTKVVSR